MKWVIVLLVGNLLLLDVFVATWFIDRQTAAEQRNRTLEIEQRESKESSDFRKSVGRFVTTWMNDRQAEIDRTAEILRREAQAKADRDAAEAYQVRVKEQREEAMNNEQRRIQPILDATSVQRVRASRLENSVRDDGLNAWIEKNRPAPEIKTTADKRLQDWTKYNDLLEQKINDARSSPAR